MAMSISVSEAPHISNAAETRAYRIPRMVAGKVTRGPEAMMSHEIKVSFSLNTNIDIVPT